MAPYFKALGILLAVTTAFGAGNPTDESTTPPATTKRPVTDIYHGVQVTDPYRWLEKGDDETVRRWSDSQNRHARGVLQHMIDRGYTRPDKLAIIGGSNGGLLMGATMVQHPQLVKAVVSSVGIYDMLRVELSPNGAFNIPEFGSIQNPDHFRALFAYSPYHNVQDGTAYPATLFLTGANDPRVDPMQSRKMTARLQAAVAGPAPILLRTSQNSGHGGGTPLNERIAQSVHVYAFLFDQLGVSYRPAKRRKGF